MSELIQSLWVGKSLSNLEHLSIQSFLDNGFIYHLYTYGPVHNVPAGAIIKDGNTIVPENLIFTYKNGSLAAFSNYFRFTLLDKIGGYWADTDIICVKNFQLKQPYVFVSQPDPDYKNNNAISSYLIKLPPNSEASREAVRIQQEHRELIITGEIQYCSGNMTTHDIVNKFKLHDFVLNWKVFATCCWEDVESLLNPDYIANEQITSQYEEIPKETLGIHFWNERWRQKTLNKNGIFHQDSIYEIFKSKHGIKPSFIEKQLIRAKKIFS